MFAIDKYWSTEWMKKTNSVNPGLLALLSPENIDIWADPEGGGGRRSGPLLKNHKNKGFLSNAGPDLQKNHKATKPGHRELIISPIDPNGEPLVFDSLFCISQYMWASPYALNSSQTMNKGNKKWENIHSPAFFNCCMLINGCHIFGKPRPSSY